MISALHRPSWLPDPDEGEGTFIGEVLRKETVGGFIALSAAVVALVWANLGDASYEHLRHLDLGPLDLEHVAADGALAVFFFVAGLELKREFVVGSLRRPRDAAVPIVAAACGVAVPAGIFVAVLALSGNADELRGWAIPSATDIAFALAVLAVVGSALPSPLRAFLLTLAVVDDLIVIVIIAVAYTERLHLLWLTGALIGLAAYGLLQRARVRTSLVYVPLAALVWWCAFQSGVHATVAGVALGLLTRVRPDDTEQRPPAERLQHRLTPISSGVAVPFFALLSAGVPLSLSGAVTPLALAVALGLVLGKPVGVLGGTWLVTRFTRADLDAGIGWRDLGGMAILCGVGFTVSLLVADLSFEDARREQAKSAVLIGSLVAAVVGGALLRRRNRVHRES